MAAARLRPRLLRSVGLTLAAAFVRSGPGCGNHARLMEFQNGSTTLVRDFAKNRDSFETYAVTSTQLVREVNSCRTDDANVDLTPIS